MSGISAQRRVRICVALGTALAAVVALAAPANAAGSPPATPVLVAPADGATTVSSGSTLQVRAGDPEGDPLTVRFYGRPKQGTGSTNPASPFSFLVLPDTQWYSAKPSLSAIYTQQTQWVAANRASLNTAFVAHLGDLAGDPTPDQQWQVASNAQKVLDDAGVPNSVLPGNHDMVLSTGDAPLFRQYFPPSRYANASWNTATTRYGGYLGQNQFGTDPVNRQNMDNYALFSAGGMDFLLLNLEFNAPDYVVDWAKKVLAAYPDRRAIVTTHSYLDYLGNISTQMDRQDGVGNSPQQLWQKLISPSCSIFMVASGHFSIAEGDKAEFNRTDTNSCGQPVLSVLTDYQDRANGGNGWLRYYTFKPSTNAIQATTYSPYLNQYETDANSSFTMPYDMSVRTPVAFTQIGSATVASGGVASVPVPAVADGTDYEWYATADDGTTVTTGPTWSYRTAPAAPTVLARDAFGRTVTNGWGTADVGNVYTLVGATSQYAVANGQGVQTVKAGIQTSAQLKGVSSTSTDVTETFGYDALPNGNSYVWVSGRQLAGGEYGAKLIVSSTGAVRVTAARGDTELASASPAGLSLAGGARVAVRTQVEGTSPTTIRVRAWKAGTTEPTTWQATATDSTAALQAPGWVRSGVYLSSSVTNGPLVVRFDDLQAAPIGTATPPVNQVPTASFTSTTSGLTANVNGSASSDPDGTIASYGWAFGDGTTGAGPTASHAYAAAGTYQVTLTVADNTGATASVTRPVTVTAPAVNQAPTASFTSTTADLTANLNGSASSDPDGTIASYGWAFGDGTAGTGPTASHAYAAAGTYQVTLTVTDNAGATGSVTKPVTVTAPAPTTTLAQDSFTRTTTGGWGSAETGGAWSTSGAASTVSVNNGTGVHSIGPGVRTTTTLAGVSSTQTDLTTTLSLDTMPNGPVYASVIGRVVGSAEYAARVRVLVGGAVELHVERSGTAVTGGTLTGVTLGVGQKLNVRVQVSGTSPTTVRVRAWKAGTTEPTTWFATLTDSTAGLQAAGGVRISTYLSSSTTGGAVNVRYDDLKAVKLP
ncbi:PKD domain-containing protein [Spongisporangium articulatum]|uniref:PKD domain-containing protein n=1 Tax=Spongisporangium articulatum TaxID=3362603 RepID=A0ABW8ANH9_9ACTN